MSKSHFRRNTQTSRENIETLSWDGYAFSINDDNWKLSRDETVYLKWTRELLSSKLRSNYLYVLSTVAQNQTAASVRNASDRFRHFSSCSHLGRALKEVSLSDLISYWGSLDKKHQWYMGTLRSFLRKWIELRIHGIEEGVERFLDDIKIPGNEKGRAVRTRSPTEGALTDLEFEALHQSLVDAFERGALKIEPFALVMTLLGTGRRPAQVADLKVGDLIRAQANDGLTQYFLNVPSRKKRGVKWRQSFKPFALSHELGSLLESLSGSNVNNIAKRFGVKKTIIKNYVPLFPRWEAINKFCQDHKEDIEFIVKSDYFHRTSSEISNACTTITDNLAVPSERLKKAIHVTPIRMRRTVATRAAREGYGALVIAEMLDHSDTQNARVYTENVAEDVNPINEAVSRQLAPYAQAFAGVLVDRERDAIRGDDLSSRIRSEVGGVGTCGHYGFCGAYGPIACYTCRHFQPWVNGPHKEILKELLEEQKRVKQITGDSVISKVNDRSIIAVTEVIQQCEKRLKIDKEARND